MICYLSESCFWFFALGGGLDIADTTPGQLAEFKMWGYEMSADEVNVTPCKSLGSISSWDMLKAFGTPLESVEDFPSCKGKPQKLSCHTLILSNLEIF